MIVDAAAKVWIPDQDCARDRPATVIAASGNVAVRAVEPDLERVSVFVIPEVPKALSARMPDAPACGMSPEVRAAALPATVMAASGKVAVRAVVPDLERVSVPVIPEVLRALSARRPPTPAWGIRPDVKGAKPPPAERSPSEVITRLPVPVSDTATNRPLP